MNNFKEYLNNYSKKITGEILNLIEKSNLDNSSLIDAMKYSVEVGGKRLRPILVLEISKIFGVDYNNAKRVASSIELIHCYSLVHDDLPAMDDDYTRRGHPTCHIKYDYATAILVGDALQTLAFEILSDKKTHNNSDVRCELINELAKSSGFCGMVGGQKLDLEAENMTLGLNDIKKLQRLKTGELFRFSCISGCILGGGGKENYIDLEKYALNLGLAFQIQDDLLDIEGDERKVGKKINKDIEKGKQTFITIMGVEKAKKNAKKLIDEALEIISSYGKVADQLLKITKHIINRSS